MGLSKDCPSGQSKQRLQLWSQLLQTTRLIESEIRNKLRSEFSSTLPRFEVMAALQQHPKGLKMSELSAQLMVSNGNITGIVDRLEKDTLVERVSVSGDRRATRVKLSAAGVEAFALMHCAHESWVHDLLHTMDRESIDSTEEILHHLRRGIQD